MSEKMIDAVYSYRKNATNAMELRNTAMVLLGMRMGLRASDILNLKINNFDWTTRTLSIVQKKTLKAITLPIPTDAGNSVYKYITQGRPQSGTFGVGFVFIRHKSPYSGLGRSECKRALVRILLKYGLALPRGQGFHITRRSFATQLLKAKTPIDSLVGSLGHKNRMAVNKYLAHDDDGMRLCPLSFKIGGAKV